MAAKDSPEQDVSTGQPSIQQDDSKAKKKDSSGTRYTRSYNIVLTSSLDNPNLPRKHLNV